MADAGSREARERVVRAHMEAENRLDFAAALATFSHPRYELVATGRVYDGPEAVMGYYRDSRTAVPDQRNEVRALHHADEAVIVEIDLLGTPTGTSRAFRCPMVALFFFEGDGIVCERVYFDSATIRRQGHARAGAVAPPTGSTGISTGISRSHSP